MVTPEAFSELKRRFHGRIAAPRVAAEATFPSGLVELDTLLGGGFPSGALVTLEGAPTSGRWSIAARLLAQATQRGLGAIIDDGCLYPPALSQAGVRLDRLLIVPGRTPLGTARAADILIRSQSIKVVAFAAPVLRAAIWSRLAGLAHRNGTVLLAIAASASSELSAATALRLECRVERVMLRGSRGLWCTFCGYDVRAGIKKYKCARIGSSASIRAATEDTGALRERFLKRIGDRCCSA